MNPIDGSMLDGMRSRFRENGAHLSALLTRQAGKVRRYRKIDVASGPVPDGLVVIPDIVHIDRTTSKPICLRQLAYGESSLSSPPISSGVSSGGFL